MSYINGETLENYLEFHKEMSLKDIKLIIMQILDGLLYCKEQFNVFNCKLNPSNIYISKDLQIKVKIYFVLNSKRLTSNHF